MDMMDGLTMIGAAIHVQLTAVEGELIDEFSCDIPQSSDSGLVGVYLAECVRGMKIGDKVLWDDQDVYWCLGIDVADRDIVVVLIDNICRDLSINDFLKNTGHE